MNIELSHDSEIHKKLINIEQELRADGINGKNIISAFQVGSTADTVGKAPKHGKN